ncbi:hypothetical protein ABK040_009047 [Willaertia magna]
MNINQEQQQQFFHEIYGSTNYFLKNLSSSSSSLNSSVNSSANSSVNSSFINNYSFFKTFSSFGSSSSFLLTFKNTTTFQQENLNVDEFKNLNVQEFKNCKNLQNLQKLNNFKILKNVQNSLQNGLQNGLQLFSNFILNHLKLKHFFIIQAEEPTTLEPNLEPTLQNKNSENLPKKVKVIILGGGSAGINIYSQLLQQSKFLYKKTNNNLLNLDPSDILIIEPNNFHFYQPLFTLIGGGIKSLQESKREISKILPKNSKIVKDECVKIDPLQNLIFTKNGNTLQYDYLIIVTGMKIYFNEIKNLFENLKDFNSNVVTNYSEEFVSDTFVKLKRQVEFIKKEMSQQNVDNTSHNLSHFKKFNFLFTMPPTKIKCGGAPLKIQFLIDDYLRKEGVRDFINLEYITAGSTIFGNEYYAKILENIRKEKEINVIYNFALTEIDGDKAIFRNCKVDKDDCKADNLLVKKFDFIHVTPHLYGQEFLKNNYKENNLCDEEGFVKVDKYTLQHVNYKNIFSCGDASNLPTSKTVAAITRQTPVLIDNLLHTIIGKELHAKYDGYTSCPITTDYSKLLLAEFKYDGQLARTFHFPPFFNQDVPHRLFFVMKERIFPMSYWNLFLTGRWYGPSTLFRPNHAIIVK